MMEVQKLVGMAFVEPVKIPQIVLLIAVVVDQRVLQLITGIVLLSQSVLV